MEIFQIHLLLAITSFVNSGVLSFVFFVYRIQRLITCITDDLTEKNRDTTHGHKVHICVHHWIQITYFVTKARHEVSQKNTRKPAFWLFAIWIPRFLRFSEYLSAKTTQDAKRWVSDQPSCLFHGRKIQHHHPSLGDRQAFYQSFFHLVKI